MEALIAGITVGGSLITSLISVYTDRRIRDNDEYNINFNNHNIFINIDFWIKNDINNSYYSATHENEAIQYFLITRLKIIKKNLKKLIENDYADKEYLIKKIMDMINGENEYIDIRDLSHYIESNVSTEFINKFNIWDNRSNLILLYYLETINEKNVNNILYDFFNLYLSSLNSMLKTLIVDINLLVCKNSDENNYIYKKINGRLKSVVLQIKEKLNIEKYIKELLKNENIFIFNNYLFHFDENGTIIYCSELFLNKTGYKIENVIGSNIMTLSHNENINQIINFLENGIQVIKIKIHTKNDIFFNIIIKKFNKNDINLCFII
jgi:hypothetical protein